MGESVVIVEYIETVVSVVYAIYIAALCHLPNAKDYKDMAGFTEQTLYAVVTNILIYAFMELLSLVDVHLMLKRQFGIYVTCQLAFALEGEWSTYQCEFVAWIIVIFRFLLVPSGTNYYICCT